MFALDKMKFRTIKEDSCFGEFIVGPLPQGYGITLSNALRRILLSSIEGAAITSVSISGVKHEYSSLPGVVDDVLTILMKLKRLAISSYSDDVQILELNVSGKKVVKAKDIKLTSSVEISNPDLDITELTTSKAKLNMKMEVEKGTGYVSSDESKRSKVGVLPLDANYSPVKKVIVEVSKTRIDQQINLDEIKLVIYTNGSMTPRIALEKAVQIYYTLVSRFALAIKGELEEEVEKKEAKASKEDNKSLSSDLDIDKLNLSARLNNALIKAGYKNLTELEGKSPDEIMEIRGLGQRSAEELVDIMKSYKLNVED